MKAASHTIVFQKNAQARDQLKDESLAVNFNLLICLSWVASRPVKETVEPVEYLLRFVLWKLAQCSAVHSLYQNGSWTGWNESCAFGLPFECIALWGLWWWLKTFKNERKSRILLIARMWRKRGMSNDKYNAISSMFVRYLREKYPRNWGSTACSGELFPRVLGNSEFYGAEVGMWKQHDWLGGVGFPGKASRSRFLGTGERKLSWKAVISACFL